MQPKKIIQFVIVFALCMFALPAFAQEEQTTDCTYEVVQVFQDGVLVSETKTRKCKEQNTTSTKFDPDNKLGDYIKKKAVDLGSLAILIEIIKD